MSCRKGINKNEMKIDNETIVSLKILSKMIGLSERQIQRLVKEGVIKKNDNGKYLLVESVQGYLSYVVDKNDTNVDLKDEKIKEEESYEHNFNNCSIFRFMAGSIYTIYDCEC